MPKAQPKKKLKVRKKSRPNSSKTDVRNGGVDPVRCAIHRTYEINLGSFSCPKKSQHLNFIEVNKFKQRHLLKPYRYDDVEKVVRILADLTVQITVEANTTPKSLGSGRVKDVYIKQKCNKKDCYCNLVQENETWYEVKVMTAAHVVKDNVAASKTTCKLFFDSLDSKYVVIKGLRVWSDEKRDYSVLSCNLCDQKVALRLNELIRDLFQYRQRVIDMNRMRALNSRVAIIVSHPHGLPKHISVGKWIERPQEFRGHKLYNSYKYSTCTCPGTSGAFVYTLGAGIYCDENVHTGAEGTENISSPGFIAFDISKRNNVATRKPDHEGDISREQRLSGANWCSSSYTSFVKLWGMLITILIIVFLFFFSSTVNLQ